MTEQNNIGKFLTMNQEVLEEELQTNYLSVEPTEGEEALQPLTYTMSEDWMEKQKKVDAWIEEYRMKHPGASTRNIHRALERNFKNILK